jgi:cobaltochelatase CobT
MTFLADCSGSMKQHGANVAVMVDVFSRTLDQLGVTNEVLGFTTGDWNGGKARRDWMAAGRQSHPGRLNETCHLVFKDAASGWRRSRSDIAALMKADLFGRAWTGKRWSGRAAGSWLGLKRGVS